MLPSNEQLHHWHSDENKRHTSKCRAYTKFDYNLTVTILNCTWSKWNFEKEKKKKKKAGIKGSWFVNHESVSWSHKPKIHKTSMFHKLFFPKYNFKVINAGNICMSICLELIGWNWLMKDKTLSNVLACFKLCRYTLTWKIMKTLHVQILWM